MAVNNIISKQDLLLLNWALNKSRQFLCGSSAIVKSN